MFTSRIDEATRDRLVSEGDVTGIMEYVNGAASELRHMYTNESAKYPHRSVEQQRWLAKAFGVDTFCDALYGRGAAELADAIDDLYDEIDFELRRLDAVTPRNAA